MKAALTDLETMLKTVVTQVQQATLMSAMQGTDISEFFPVENNQQLERFMDRDHPDWNSRKMEFYHFLYTTASDVKKGFARGLIKAIFSRSYILGAKWPSSGYRNILT